MTRITTALGLVAVAATLFAGAPATADPICEYRDPVYSGCTYIYVDENGDLCVTGGGKIAGRRYQFAPC